MITKVYLDKNSIYLNLSDKYIYNLFTTHVWSTGSRNMPKVRVFLTYESHSAFKLMILKQGCIILPYK